MSGLSHTEQVEKKARMKNRRNQRKSKRHTQECALDNAPSSRKGDPLDTFDDSWADE